MVYHSPEEAFEEVKARTSETVKSYFPLEGKKNRLVASEVWVDDDKHIDDIEGQLDSKLKGKTWSVPIKAKLELRDTETGKVKDTATVTVGSLPKVTRRYSYIVNGNEWVLNNQFRLKSGVYNHIQSNGVISGQWNLEKGQGFSMRFDPSKKKMQLAYGTSDVNLYPILKVMGVSDSEIEKKWGKEILASNKDESSEEHIRKMYKSITKKTPQSIEEAKNTIAEEFLKTSLRPDSTKRTLGKPFTSVNGQALLSGSERLLQISRQEAPPDDRDSLEFKDLYSAEDLVKERLSKDARRDITRRLSNVIDKHQSVREMITPETFGKPIKDLFTSSTLAERPDQHNPLSFVINARKTTVMGKHGIDEDRKITLDAQAINPSHMGFIDVIHTPESKRVGAVTQLSLNAIKKDKDLYVHAVNMKTGKDELIDAGTALRSNLAFPDQYKKEGNKLTPRNKTVKVTDKTGTVAMVKPGEVDYALRSTKGMFDLTSNLIPFLQSNQGTRAMMATKQLEQSVPLTNREKPLVQVKGEGSATFEDHLGRFNSHRSPVAGVVEKVERGKITIRDGKSRVVVPIYADFPLNDNKAFIDSRVYVKPGDKVQKDHLLADTSFTKDGVLSLGTNLKVAYTPWKGLNFEDGIVISDSASKKLTSEHLHRESVTTTPDTILDKKKFIAETAGQWTKEQSDKLDDEAIVKPGETVHFGDPLIGELRKEDLSTDQKHLALFSRKALKPVRPRVLTWTKDSPGVVSRVVKHGKETTVYVKTQVAAEVGDKLVARHANKGIITKVIPDNEMPHDKDGNHIEILLNPAGIPSRVNLGQVLETAAAKIAQKTGKTYVVNNFDPDNPNYLKTLKEEMKKAGVKDTEDLTNPVTGEVYKDVLTGPQYFLKLHHTAEKKLAARSDGPYTNNLTPSGGGDKGGKSMDVGGLYAMLAYGARANIRESQTLRSEMNDDLWDRIQTGQPIPPPKVPFVFEKFIGYLKGSGIDVKKDGNTLILEPMTDKKVLELSNGEIKDPQKTIRSKDLKPEPGGLFDPKLTGTKWPSGEFGTKWTHITLAQRMPNPIFEKPISALLEVNQAKIKEVVAGKETLGGKTGPDAIVDALKTVDVKSQLSDLEEKVKKARGSKLNTINKKIKYLRALSMAEITPHDAYTLKHVPVLPPNMRPMSVQQNGDISEADVNALYSKGIGSVNHQIKTMDPSTPDEDRHELSGALYDALEAVSLTGSTYKKRYRMGLLSNVAEGTAKKPKEGFFQSKVVGKRQNLSMQGTIVPNPSLNLDEVALPRKAAAEVYKPFVVSRLVRLGYSPLQAQQEVKKNSAIANRALEVETSERPVLLKRNPVLHKYGVQAFKPRLTDAKTIEIHPLVTGGFGADFDGNCILGTSKLLLTVPITGGSTPSKEDLERRYEMKFVGDTVIYGIVDSGCLVEIEIRDLMHKPETARKDKNGADVYDVPPGIKVVSYDPETGDPVLSPITHFTIEGSCPIVKVTTRSGHSVTASDNESLCVYDSETGGVRKISPKDAMGKLCPIIRTLPKMGREFDSEVGWMIGAFVSDGFFTSSNVVGLSKVDVGYRDRFAAALARFEGKAVNRKTYSTVHDGEISGLSVKEHFTGVKNSIELFRYCYSSDERSFADRACLYKKIDESLLLRMSEPALYGVLSGLLDGDGSFCWVKSKGKNNRQAQISLSTSSSYLVSSVQLLCRLLGIRLGVTATEPKEGRLQKHTAFTLTFSTVDMALISDSLVMLPSNQRVADELGAEPPSKDDRDIVPIPASVVGACTSLNSLAAKKDPPLRSSMATLKSKQKKTGGLYVTRAFAHRVLSAIEPTEISEKWRETIVDKTLVAWSPVESISSAGTDTVYDISVPTKVFAANDGLVVWDTMSAFVPISQEAVQEAKKMAPSSNLFSPSTGDIAYKPSHEALLGLYSLSETGKKTNLVFDSASDAARAVKDGKIGLNDVVKIRDASDVDKIKTAEAAETTVGRLLLYSSIPESSRDEKMLKDLNFVLNKKNLSSLLSVIGKKSPGDYAAVSDSLRNRGNYQATGTSIGLDDFEPDTEYRDKAVAGARKHEAEIRKGKGTEQQKNDAVIDMYSKAFEDVEEKSKKKFDSSNNRMYKWVKSGARSEWGQFKQMALAPGLSIDAHSRVIPVPITKSYSEGLDIGDYWTAMQGARMGIISKVKETEAPGALYKKMVTSTMNQVIVSDDCGTTRGIALDAEDPNALDRYTSKEINLGIRGGEDKGVIPAGTLVTPEVLSRLKNNKVKEVPVRTPLKCAHGEGICKKCMGLNENGQDYSKGTNVGVLAAQALGEPSTQMVLSTFHGGGVVGASGSKSATVFDRVEQLAKLPETLPGSATLATEDGVVEDVKKDPAGGWKVTIGGASHYVPSRLGLTVEVGQEINKGEAISTGPKNPREMLPLVGIGPVQKYLTDELASLYRSTPLHRRNTEVFVRALTNLSVVKDAGSKPDILPGDLRPRSELESFNRSAKKGMQPVLHEPVLRGAEVLPLDMHEDWLAKLQTTHLKETLLEGASRRWQSNLHGVHPIPGIAYGAEFGVGTPEEPWNY